MRSTLAKPDAAGYPSAMAIINWNGSDLPDALRPLPAGRYIVEALDESASLTLEEEDGLIQALDSLSAGSVIDHEEVRARVLKRVATRRSFGLPKPLTTSRVRSRIWSE